MEVLDTKTDEIELNNAHLKRVGKPIKKEELVIAGMVVDVKQGTTRKGSPYGILTLQDYTDTHKFAVFNDDYINYNKYFTIGYLLLIKGEMQPVYYNDEEEFKIKEIYLLQSVRAGLVEIIKNTLKAKKRTTE